MLLRNKIIKRIWKEHKNKIVFIYGINALESLLFLLVPYCAGLLIDSFIYSKGYGLYIFAGVYLSWQIVAVFRRITDTKIFTNLFNSECQYLIEKSQSENLENSIINARVELMKQVVDFFESDLPFVTNSIISIFGSAFLLYTYSPKLVATSLIIVLPSILINSHYSKKIKKVTESINDCYETQIDVIESKDRQKIKKYFDEIRINNIKKSTYEAFNFNLIEIFVLAMILSSVYVICKTENLNYGSVAASYGIILRFAYGFDFLPHTTSKLASLKDIIERLEK